MSEMTRPRGAATEPRGAEAATARPAAAPETRETPTRTRAGRRGGLALIGALVLLLGIWSALVAYIGPQIGIDMGGSGAWAWTGRHAVLFLAPGMAAIAAAMPLLGLGSSRSGDAAPARGLMAVAALVAIAAGAWLVVGADAWTAVRGGAPAGVAGTSLNAFLGRLAAEDGPGVLLAVLGAMALGLCSMRRRAVAAVPATVDRSASGAEILGRRIP